MAPEEWGFWHWAVDFVFILAGQLRDLGLPAEIVRDHERPYGNFLFSEVSMGIVMLLGSWAVAPYLAGTKGSDHLAPLLQVLGLFLFFEGIGKVPLTFFEAELRLERVIGPEIARNATYAFLAITLAWLDFDIYSMAIAHVAATAAFAGVLWWRAFPEISLKWRPTELPAMIRRGLPLMVIAILFMAQDGLDYQILWLKFPEETIGLYGSAMTLALLLPRVIEYPIRRALYPAFVMARDRPEQFFSTYRIATIFVMAGHLLAAGLFWLNASLILSLAWGDTYREAADFLRYLCLVPLTQPFFRCAEDILLPKGRESILILGVVLNITALVVFGLWLTTVMAAPGMALAKVLPVGAIPVTLAIYFMSPGAFWLLTKDLLKAYGVTTLAFGSILVLVPREAELATLLCSLAAAIGCVLVFIKIFWTDFHTVLTASDEKG